MDDVGPWDKLKVIGKGGSSTVYKCCFKSSGGLVAVKEIEKDGMTKHQVNGIEGEVQTMKNLVHRNIVQYRGTQQNANKFYIFLEYADRGSLRQYYQKHGALSEIHCANCIRQVLSGLEYLHSKDIAHRDIKGANVLLTKAGIMKLADFGASKRYDMESIVSGLKGTPHWMAPEVIKGTQLTNGWLKADVWSVGCTVVELLTGKIPYSMYDNPMTAMYHIASGQPPPIIGVEASESCRQFILLCCNAEANSRPSISTLLQHPFVLQFYQRYDSRHISDTEEYFEPLDLPELVNSDDDESGSSNDLLEQQRREEEEKKGKNILDKHIKSIADSGSNSFDGESTYVARLPAGGGASNPQPKAKNGLVGRLTDMLPSRAEFPKSSGTSSEGSSPTVAGQRAGQKRESANAQSSKADSSSSSSISSGGYPTAYSQNHNQHQLPSGDVVNMLIGRGLVNVSDSLSPNSRNLLLSLDQLPKGVGQRPTGSTSTSNILSSSVDSSSSSSNGSLNSTVLRHNSREHPRQGRAKLQAVVESESALTSGFSDLDFGCAGKATGEGSDWRGQGSLDEEYLDSSGAELSPEPPDAPSLVLSGSKLLMQSPPSKGGGKSKSRSKINNTEKSVSVSVSASSVLDKLSAHGSAAVRRGALEEMSGLRKVESNPLDSCAGRVSGALMHGITATLNVGNQRPSLQAQFGPSALHLDGASKPMEVVGDKTKKKSKHSRVRSQSASAGLTGSNTPEMDNATKGLRIVLPPMASEPHKTPNRTNIPSLPLRYVQSAPSVSRISPAPLPPLESRTPDYLMDHRNNGVTGTVFTSVSGSVESRRSQSSLARLSSLDQQQHHYGGGGILHPIGAVPSDSELTYGLRAPR